MNKNTKNYLKFCGVNTIVLFTVTYTLLKRFEKEGYEINKENKINIYDIITLVGILLMPVINILATTSIASIISNEELYEEIKDRLLEKGFIKEKEAGRKYTKIKL
jgi:hypothetical protein